ncbi:hypothetical protein MAR_006626, partial [Mya arenaria]
APLKANVWLEKLWGLHSKQELTKEDFVSWSAYHASIQLDETAPSTVEAHMPLFLEFAHSDTIIKHLMNVVKAATEYLDTVQNPVLVMDQPLFAIAQSIGEAGENLSNFTDLCGKMTAEQPQFKYCSAVVKTELYPRINHDRKFSELPHAMVIAWVFSFDHINDA